VRPSTLPGNTAGVVGAHQRLPRRMLSPGKTPRGHWHRHRHRHRDWHRHWGWHWGWHWRWHWGLLPAHAPRVHCWVQSRARPAQARCWGPGASALRSAEHLIRKRRKDLASEVSALAQPLRAKRCYQGQHWRRQQGGVGSGNTRSGSGSRGMVATGRMRVKMVRKLVKRPRLRQATAAAGLLGWSPLLVLVLVLLLALLLLMSEAGQGQRTVMMSRPKVRERRVRVRGCLASVAAALAARAAVAQGGGGRRERREERARARRMTWKGLRAKRRVVRRGAGGSRGQE